MPAQKVSDDEFIRLFAKLKSPTLVAKSTGINLRNVHARRRRIEKRHSIQLAALPPQAENIRLNYLKDVNKARSISLEIKNGCIIVGSDCHYWPGLISTAHRAFVKFAKDLKPSVIVLNGDIMDNVTNSAHARIAWDKAPDIKEELSAVCERLDEIQAAAKKSKLIRTIGNHDVRFETALSARVPTYEGVKGFSLDDHLIGWDSTWAVRINDHTIIKHRIKGGVHATWNNTVDGISTVTGHLHALQVRPRTVMSTVNNGTIYGVDTGTMADPWGPQFNYLEEGPRQWRSGFAVLSFIDGVLMPPEVVQVLDEGIVYFRGQKIEV
jgi:predicted phosphodiesterase